MFIFGQTSRSPSIDMEGTTTVKQLFEDPAFSAVKSLLL